MINLIFSFIDDLFQMHFHTNTIEELYEFIPREILPEEYGGNAGKLDDLKEQFWRKCFGKGRTIYIF